MCKGHSVCVCDGGGGRIERCSHFGGIRWRIIIYSNKDFLAMQMDFISLDQVLV